MIASDRIPILAAAFTIAYAVIGMGALLAATTHAPLMSFLIVFEMTLEYQLVPALMLACLAAYHVSRAIRPQSIYHEALHRGTAVEEKR